VLDSRWRRQRLICVTRHRDDDPRRYLRSHCRGVSIGVFVHFISGSVLTGFFAGAALYITSTQINKLFGIESSASDAFFWETFVGRIWYTGTHLAETNPETLAVGVAGIVLLVLGERYLPHAPECTLVVVLSIALLSVTNLQARGVAIVGSIPERSPVADGTDRSQYLDAGFLSPSPRRCFFFRTSKASAPSRRSPDATTTEPMRIRSCWQMAVLTSLLASAADSSSGKYVSVGAQRRCRRQDTTH